MTEVRPYAADAGFIWGLQVLGRSLISIGCRKTACDALAHIKRRHLFSGAFRRSHYRVSVTPIKNIRVVCKYLQSPTVIDQALMMQFRCN